jgi:hypothetical protein
MLDSGRHPEHFFQHLLITALLSFAKGHGINTLTAKLLRRGTPRFNWQIAFDN